MHAAFSYGHMPLKYSCRQNWKIASGELLTPGNLFTLVCGALDDVFLKLDTSLGKTKLVASILNTKLTNYQLSFYKPE